MVPGENGGTARVGQVRRSDSVFFLQDEIFDVTDDLPHSILPGRFFFTIIFISPGMGFSLLS